MLQQKFETISYKFIEKSICHVELCRPKSFNSCTPLFFQEFRQLFTQLNSNDELRVIILTGQGKHFTSGLDLGEASNMFAPSDRDPSRKGIDLYNLVKDWQDAFNHATNIRVPVLVGMHGGCIGAALDLGLSCDIRYCTKDVSFSIKEVDIGLCADIGTLPRIQLFTGNESLTRELIFTGRKFDAKEALQIGLVSKISENNEEMFKSLLETAKSIASKSPIAVYAIKKVLNQTHKQNINNGLEYVALMNQTMLQTADIPLSVQAFLQKKNPSFPKL